MRHRFAAPCRCPAAAHFTVDAQRRGGLMPVGSHEDGARLWDVGAGAVDEPGGVGSLFAL